MSQLDTVTIRKATEEEDEKVHSFCNALTSLAEQFGVDYSVLFTSFALTIAAMGHANNLSDKEMEMILTQFVAAVNINLAIYDKERGPRGRVTISGIMGGVA